MILPSISSKKPIIYISAKILIGPSNVPSAVRTSFEKCSRRGEIGCMKIEGIQREAINSQLSATFLPTLITIASKKISLRTKTAKIKMHSS